MSIRETLSLYHDPAEVNKYFEEINKLVNVAQSSYLKTRQLVINNEKLDNNDKNTIMLMLDSLWATNRKDKLKSSDYDEKPYTQMFFSDLLKFIQTSNLKMNEFKVVLGIYEILNEANTYGNVLINFNIKKLADKTGINYSNIFKDINSLVKKNILIKREDNLYLNYNLFYRGNKQSYDNYKDIYNELENNLIDTQPLNYHF
jgi:predicted transcriptional regulator